MPCGRAKMEKQTVVRIAFPHSISYSTITVICTIVIRVAMEL